MTSSDKRKAIQKAMTLVQEGQLEKAIEEYRAILDVDPSDVSLCNALGDLYLQVGARSEATACYLKLVDALKAEGLIFRAIAVYKKILKLDPDDLSILRACADLYAMEGLRAEAKHLYLREVEASLRLGEDKQALEAYERLIALEPGGDATRPARLASLFTREGRRSEAADLLGRLAQECRAQGQLENARTLYRQMVEIAPGAFTGWYCLGRVEFEAGRLEDAEQSLHRAAEIDAGSPLPHLLLGHVYEQQRQLDRAKEAWRTLLAFDPTHQEAHHRIGLLYLNEGDTEAAARAFDAAAHSLGESGEVERAVGFLHGLGPAADHPLLQERLGELLERSGRRDEATAAYRHGADLCLRTGRLEERRRMLGRILSLDPDDTAAVEALRGAKAVEEASVTRAAMTPGASSLSSVEAEFDLRGARSPQAGGAERAEDMRVIPGGGQESLQILRAKEDSVEVGPGALAVVDFYLEQGMEAEARALLRRLVAADPGNVEASRQLESLESKALTEGMPAAEVEVFQLELPDGSERPAAFGTSSAEPEHTGGFEAGSTGVAHDLGKDEREYVNLMAELEESLLAGSDPGAFASGQMLPQPDTEHPIERSREACEAHYKLGIAYRELGLVDEAIEEFRRSAADERLQVRARDMVGRCLLDRGEAEAAIHELDKALLTTGRPAEEYYSIKSNLAEAYQAIGDLKGAVAVLRELHTDRPSDLDDVTWRLRELEGRLGRGEGLTGAPDRSVDATRRTRSG